MNEYYDIEDIILPQVTAAKKRRPIECIMQGLSNYMASPDYKGTVEPKKLLAAYQRRLSTLDKTNFQE
jgi:hypothetical protein